MQNQKWRFTLASAADAGSIRLIKADWSVKSDLYAVSGAGVQSACDDVYGASNTTVTEEVSGKQFLIEFIGALANTAVDCPIVDSTVATVSGVKIIDTSLIQLSPLDAAYTVNALIGGSLTDTGTNAVTFSTADAPTQSIWGANSGYFDNSFLSGSDAGFPSGSAAVTMTARVKCDVGATGNLALMFGYGKDNPGSQGVTMSANNSTGYFAYALDVSGGGGSVTSSWQDIGFTWDGTTLTTYLNGSSVYSYIPSLSIVSESFRIGKSASYGYPWTGLIREVTVYSGAKSGSWFASGGYINPSDYTTTEVQAGGGGGPVSLSTSIGIASSTSADIKGLIGRAASFDIASAASADIKGLQSLSTSISIATAATGSLQKINPGGSGGGMLTLTGVG